MKKSDLKQLIREEIIKVLSENRQTLPLKDLSLDTLKIVAEPIANKLVIRLPLPQDSLRQLDLNSPYSQEDLDSYKNELINKFGANILNASIILDPSEVWSKKIIIDDENFRKAKEKYTQGKSAWIDRETSAGRTSGLD
jgi:hypothetical protein